ncbi:ATP-binding cassette domain-containing protein [Rathayibacter soli]|uniref:ATP-binding cassette domain-containing protein n=1 Tax=Rathayibacter soli TaxID=3144168 RepID=UPI0027E49731|nr:ATP-binding cassette domain-containing protein [Glaciibacter superstes]
MTATRPMIAVHGLKKRYGTMKVLDGIDLNVETGNIFALLGPNGAGKTTTVNILTTLIKPDAGTVHVDGIDVLRNPRAARGVISLTGQYASVDEFQTGEENLAMMARLAHLGGRVGRARTRELLEQFDLVAAAHRPARTYSGGMRRRLDLAISLIARPPVVFLDEPTTGLDPRSRTQMWAVVRELADAGTTVLLTTQYLEEADRLADMIAVIDGGTVIAGGTASELKSRVSGEHIELAFEDQRSFDTATSLALPRAVADTETLSIRVPTTGPVATIRDLLATADARALAVANIAIIKPTLDDVFLALTGHVTSAADAAREADASIEQNQTEQNQTEQNQEVAA